MLSADVLSQRTCVPKHRIKGALNPLFFTACLALFFVEGGDAGLENSALLSESVVGKVEEFNTTVQFLEFKEFRNQLLLGFERVGGARANITGE